MPIAFLTLELHIEAAQSVKDRRQVVRSLKDRLRAHFNVAVAELDADGLWNRATLGVVSVSDSRDYLDGLMKHVERQAVRIANNGGAEVAVAIDGEVAQSPVELWRGIDGELASNLTRPFSFDDGGRFRRFRRASHVRTVARYEEEMQ